MNRHEATRRVMTTLANPASQIKLSYTAPDGSHPLVVTTAGEHFSDVMKRVDALGGSANLVLAEVKRFEIMVIEALAEDVESESEDVNADISMGMFWLRVSRRAKRTGTFHIGRVSGNAPAASQVFEYV